MAEKNKKTQ